MTESLSLAFHLLEYLILFQFPDRIKQDDDFLDDTHRYEALSSVSEDSKAEVGFEAEKFIIDCQFAGHTCYPR